jgi:fucose permease
MQQHLFNGNSRDLGMNEMSANIWKMYVYSFFLNLHFIGGVLVPFFSDWGGISFFQIMVLQSFFALVISVLEIPSGAIADYAGRKITLSIAALCVMVGALIYSSAPYYSLFLWLSFSGDLEEH